MMQGIRSISDNLIVNFAINDLKIRYRNSVLGFLWTFLEPLLFLGVLYVVFSTIFKNEIENFPLYLLLGLILYGMLQKGTEFGLHGILSRSNWFTQIYIPREIPAISSTITASIMLIFELIIFGVFMAVFQFIPTWTIIFLPLVLALEFILVLGLCLPLSVLSVRFKDIQFIWKVLLHVGFFLSPIFYTMNVLPPIAQDVLKFSPMVQIMNMARSVTLYNQIPNNEEIFLGVFSTLIVFGVGYLVFRRYRNKVIELL